MTLVRRALWSALLAASLALGGCAFQWSSLSGLAAKARPQAAPPEGKPEAALSRPEPAPFEGAEALAARVTPTYVRVEILERGGDGAAIEGPREPGVVIRASGAVVDRRGYAVTAAHIAKSTTFRARLSTVDGRTLPAAVVAVAPRRELALLKFEPYPGMAVATLGDSRALEAGEPVLAIGTPEDKPGVAITGRIRDPRRADRIQYGDYGYDDAIELELDAAPGHSGGPLFDAGGEMIGLVASFSLGNTNPEEFPPTSLGWAVPAAAIRAYVEEIAGR